VAGIRIGRRAALAICLIVLAGTGVLVWFPLLSPPRARLTPALPPDALLLGDYSTASMTHAPLLGMGTEITDDLQVGFPPGSVVAPDLRELSLPLLRFPDAGADDYDWPGGCSYGDTGRRDCGNEFGQGSALEHFLQLDARVGARPLIVVNGEVDDPQLAARLVGYYEQHCVHGIAILGHPGPCIQPYWEIGFSPVTWKHFAVPLGDRQSTDASVILPDQYAALVSTYAAAMQASYAASIRLQSSGDPPSIQIVADEWITGATDQSWVRSVAAIDTHYPPPLYSSRAAPPSPEQIVASVRGTLGRPDIGSWLADRRNSIAQFDNSGGIGLIVGQWAIDANTNPSTEPLVYGGYIQAVVAAELFARLWQDAAAAGPNPLLAAIQYPIIGSSQEPFDATSGNSRAATAVYGLVDRYLTGEPVPLRLGATVQRDGLVGAATRSRGGAARVLLVNTDSRRPITVALQGLSRGPYQLWWLAPDTEIPPGAEPLSHRPLTGTRLTLPPWTIAVVQAGP